MTNSPTNSVPNTTTRVNYFTGLARRRRKLSLIPANGDGSTLSLDFTTGVLDPRLTFTRSTNATFINSQGLVEWAAANLQIYSQDQSQSGTWVRQDLSGVDANVGATTDPLGGNTASKLKSAATLQAHLVYSTVSTSINVGLAYTFSVYVKKAELKFVALHLASTARYTVVFDLDTGAMTTTNTTGSPTGTAYSSASMGGGWWRLSITMNSQASPVYPHICLSNSGTPGTNASGQPYYTGVLNEGIYTWGAQLNPGSSPLAYVATTTAQKFDTPRFDYDPSTLQPRGLLIEGSATNLARRSDDFNTTVTDGTQWITSGYTAGTLSTTLPDGTTGNARRLSIASGAGAFRSSTITVNESTAYTFSFWARNNGGSQARFRVWNATAGSSIVDYTLSSSNYVSQIGGANNTSSTWVRVSVTFTTPVGCTSIYVYPCSSDSGTVDLLIWGAQLETGSGASSYIPTGASTGSRAADVCTMSNITALNYNANGGTLFAHFSNNTENANFAGSIGFNNGANYAQRLRWGSGSLIGSYFQTNGTTALGSNLGGSRTSFASAKAATSYSFDGTTTSTAMSINGAQATTTPTSSAVSGVSIATAFALNSDNSSAATAYPSLAVRSVKFYPTALTMAQMNAITANP